MLNVIAIAVVASFVILLGAAYRQSKKTREELISEMQEEILVNEPAPVEPPAPVVAEVKEVVKPAPVEEVKPAAVVVEAPKAEVKEMIASQEAPIEKPKPKRKRPAKKKPAQD